MQPHTPHSRDDEQYIYYRRPRRKTFRQKEQDQALADWFGAESVLSETSGVRPLDTLISQVISKLPLDVPAHAPEILRQGWKQAAGDFISNHADLVSIANGVATIQVMQPTIRYHLKQWEPALLEKLKAQFGHDAVKSIRLIFG